MTSLIGYKLTNANHVLKLLQFMPLDYNLVKRVITYFNNLHYDKDTGILHSLPAARVHELRGAYILQAITEAESIILLTIAASIAESNSFLDIILGNYLDTKENRKKGQKTFKDLHEYLMYIMNNENQLISLQAKVYHKR